MNFILLTFLLFIAYTSSYSISKVKQRHQRETHGQDDSNSLYEVEDGGKTVKFSFPKQEKPTLREIIYYHVIEHPYPGESFHGSIEVSEESKSGSEEDDDVVVTERPFTNGHGYQFLFNNTDVNDYPADSDEVEDVTTEIVNYDEEINWPELNEEEEKEFEKLIAELYKNEPSEETTVKPENEQQTSTISTISALTTSKSPFRTEDTNKDKIEEDILNLPSANETLSKTEELEIINTELSKINVTYPSGTAEDIITEKEDKGQEVSSSEPEEVIEMDTTPLIDAKNGMNKDDVVEEKKSARASLFNQAREKYQNKMSKKQQRRKREVNAAYMPQAPILPPLNLNSLPEYVRKLISTPAPKMTTEKVQQKGSINFDEEALQKELEKRIEGIMATLKPKLLEDSDSGSNEDEGSSAQDVDYENETEDIGDKVENGKNRQARTYGMNMTMGRGYVWNDLLGEPGMYIEVGEPEDKNEITENIKPTEIPIELPSSTHYSIESKPMYMNSPNIKENSDKDHKANDDNDIFLDVKTNKPSHVIEHSTEKYTTDQSTKSATETTTGRNLETESLKGDESDKESNIEKPTMEKTDISSEKSNQEDVKDSENETATAANKNEESFTEAVIEHTTKLDDNNVTTARNKNVTEAAIEQTTKHNKNNTKLGKLETQKEDIDDKVKRKIIEITKSEILQELFKNDEFWQWLGNWTTKYTELFMKHIKNMLHDEVSRQMKKQTNSFKKQIQNEIEKALKSKEKSGVGDKDRNNQTDKQKTPDESAHLQEETPYVNNVKTGSENKENPADIDKEDSKIAEKDTEVIIDNDNIMIDGKKIPFTHNTNDDNENLLKRKKDKEREENKHHTDHFALQIKDETKEKTNVTSTKTQINVTAQNIYGNSAGSEKVTNIFIFYPQDDDEINNLKPFGNGNQENVFLIDKRKEEVQTDLTGQKDESTSTTDVPQEQTATGKPKEEIAATTVVPQAISTTKKPKEEITITTAVSKEITTTEKPKEESKEEITTTTALPQEISTTEKSTEEIKQEITTTTAIPQELTTTEKPSEITTMSDIPKETPTTEKPKDDNKQETTEAAIKNKADDVTEKPHTKESDNNKIPQEGSTDKPGTEIKEKGKDQINTEDKDNITEHIKEASVVTESTTKAIEI